MDDSQFTHNPQPSSTTLDRSITRAEVLAHVAAGSRLFEAVVQRACPAHDVAAREPCWSIPSGTTPGKYYRAVCDERVERWRRLMKASGGSIPSGHLGHLSARAAAEPRRGR